MLSTGAQAQAVGSCETGSAQAVLETSRLRAGVFNTGGLFFGGSTTSGDGYLVPKQDGASPVFAAAFWVGGTVDGEIRVAGAHYGNYNFWPGPLAEGAPPSLDCSQYDRIYEVSRQDVARYLTTAEATDDLRDWPADLGAPVLDGDGIDGNYDLAAGDQPEILGDATAFWIMNDVGPGEPHPGTGSRPLGIEVRVRAFVVERPGQVTSPVLTETTFYHYEVVNKSRQPIDSLFVSLWADVDLGDASDDYTGTDTLRNLVFVYNDSNQDQVYGTAPPAWGVQVLDGFVGNPNGRDDDFDGAVDEADEEMRMTTAPFAPKNGPDGFSDPSLAQEYFNLQRGRFPGGVPMEAYGQGLPGSFLGTAPVGDRTVFHFPADPARHAFWSAMNTDGDSTRFFSGDKRMILSTGPGRLDAGASVDVVYAMPYARGEDHLQSTTVLRSRAGVLAGVYDSGGFASRRVEAGEYRGVVTPRPEPRLTLSRVTPNPSMGRAEVRLTLPDEAAVEATVYDALGRRVAVLVASRLPEGETRLSMPRGLATGTYVLRVRVAPGGKETLTFSVVR